jgi:hypothetical protein
MKNTAQLIQFFRAFFYGFITIWSMIIAFSMVFINFFM